MTLIEMLVTITIMGLVVAAIAGLLVEAAKTQVDVANRFQAQQDAVLALNKLRREMHCATAMTGPGAGASSYATITLATQCVTGGGTTVTWCTQPAYAGSTNQFNLVRVTGTYSGSCDPTSIGMTFAEHLTTANIFSSYTCPTASSLGYVSVNLPVDTTPNDSKQAYDLTDDIVLRNTQRVVGC